MDPEHKRASVIEPATPPGRETAGLESVGGRVREERLRQKIGVRELARRVGVSASLISQVELGKASPSVATLYAMVTELGLSLDELLLERQRPDGDGFQDNAARFAVSDVPYIRPEARPTGAEVDPVIRRGGGQTVQLASGVQWERLTPLIPQDVDFLHVVYEVGGASSTEDALIRHSGSEYGYVLRGVLGVTIGFDNHQLAAGDAISFESSMPHRLVNLGDTAVEAIWVVVGRGGDPRIARSDGNR